MAQTTLLALVGGFLLAYFILLCSRIVYNIFHHPLRKIPGPRLYSASRLPYIWCVLRGRLASKLHQLHEEYGPIVRTAYNEVSLIAPEAWDKIYTRKNASHREFPKNYDHWNETVNEFSSSMFLADTKNHSRMRKALNVSFSDDVMRVHSPILERQIGEFFEGIHSASYGTSGENEASIEPIDFNAWFSRFAFDVTAQFVLGVNFKCLTEDKNRAWLKTVSKTWKFISVVSSLKSVTNNIGGHGNVMSMFRKMFQKYVDQLKLIRNAATQMLLTGNHHHPTVMTITRESLPDVPQPGEDGTKTQRYLTNAELLANTDLIVLAGTDTSSTVLPATLYLLATHPEAMAIVIKEVRSFKSENDIKFDTIDRLRYLNACISEAMRLFPAIPEGLPRLVPDPGETICGHWLPGGTFCQVSCYAANRSSAHFTDPHEFHPERWLPLSSNPSQWTEFIAERGVAKDQKYAKDVSSAFRPFSVGPRDCIGQNFALFSIRTLLARLLFRYDVSCATTDKWLDQKAFLLWRRKPLWMYIRPAQKQSL